MFTRLPIAILILLLLFPQASVSGAADGLSLWFHTVLPTLAPFMICTRLISAMGAIPILMQPIAPLFRLIFGLSQPGSYILCCGLLCGYPLGASLCSEFLSDGRISQREAQILLSICNHPSPMFVTGYLTSLMTVRVSAPWMLFCLYFPILPISIMAKWLYRSDPEENKDQNFTPADPVIKQHTPASSTSIEEILMDTSETMVLIGNYIMLFSILASWIRHLPFLSSRLCALCAGFAEITTGTRQICEAFAGKDALLPVLTATAFGGLSGIFQTKGVISCCRKPQEDGDDAKSTGIPDGTSRTKHTGLSIRHYIGWKMIHALITFLCMLALSQSSPLRIPLPLRR
ncbi:MAG: nucleoside recognition protein [Clostridiales bacterium]|nr:nucleoside recognition protein [Clostridiales bacterium]